MYAVHSQRAEITIRREPAFLWAKMATSGEIKAVVNAAQTHAENERLLQALRDSKQEHQDAIAALNTRISEMVSAVAASKADLKAAVDTL